ncbi:MAG: amidase family protein [Gammaproteobacteria bacterium]|nr:amidase family protein [Gammaproteobacteria bacterium]
MPAISLPCGLHEGLPVGVQLIGRHFDERRLLQASAALQRATDWHRARPTLAEAS